ncbi:MAG: hypothetical protein WKF84_18115 [Pyrinomonadaceae bacterium]
MWLRSIGIGRAKWKVENEQFNVQKNGGHHLDAQLRTWEAALEQRSFII